MIDPTRMSAGEAARALRAGEVDSAELDQSVRRQGARLNGRLKAISHPSKAGREEPARGRPPAFADAPLWGLGGLLKANICCRGLLADCGSRLLAGFEPGYDATVVRRLRDGGAHLLGSTTMDEFGMGSSTEFAAAGPAHNPWDPTCSPGGSSGGAAAAVAAGLAWFALGSDTGGSVRQPAHCCGVVGFKPTYGRISRYGLVAFASSLDQIGPITRTVADAAAVYSVIAGPDRRDATTAHRAPPELKDLLPKAEPELRGLRIGVPRDLLDTEIDPEVMADFQENLAVLSGAGAELEDVFLPRAREGLATYGIISSAEAASNLARYDASLYGRRVEAADFQGMVVATRGAGFGEEVKRRILLGNFVLAAANHEAYYLAAQAAREALCADFRRAFSRCRALVLPTAPTPAFALGERNTDAWRMYQSDVFTVPASLAGLPAISVPTSFNAAGLPLSLQVIGAAWDEATVLQLAREMEQARDFRGTQEPPWQS